MAVVVQQKGKNKYHVHRILMPDGSRFEYENTKNAESTGDSIVGDKTNKRLSIDSASMDSIAYPDDSVNRKFSISEENVSETTETPDVSESETDTEAEEILDEEVTDRDLLLAMAEQLVGAPAGVQRTLLRKSGVVV